MSDTPKAEFLKERLVSLDAYRGLIMIALAFNGFGLMKTAQLHLDQQPSAFWSAVRYQFDHVPWVGCAFWDLIQPSFMFMVGVAAAWSFSKRRDTGQSELRLFLHVVWRGLILVLLGIFLISNGQKTTNWSLMNVLTQIGLGYPFLYLLWHCSFRTQAVVAVLLLGGTWAAYVSYPYAGIDLTTGNDAVGVSKEWAQEHLKGVGAAWHKNANVGHAIDLHLLNLLPLQKPFAFNSGGYQTINFIPSLVTMLFGLMCGQLLRSPRAAGDKLKIMLLATLGGFLLGLALDVSGVCPLVKRIWTPSWALYSTAWCVLILAGLYGVVDVLGWKKWTFPLVVVGVNSIAIYVMCMTLKGWTARMWQTHLGPEVFNVWGAAWEPTVQATMVGFFFWLVCLWMYRQKIFIRI